MHLREADVRTISTAAFPLNDGHRHAVTGTSDVGLFQGLERYMLPSPPLLTDRMVRHVNSGPRPGVVNDNEPSASGTEKCVEFLVGRFVDEYPSYQYALVEFLVAHLTDVSRAFDGDLQQSLILAVIGQVRLRARKQAEDAGKAMPPPEKLAITASRLSDVTGIPRETVRRKLKRLAERGWIARRADGAWYLVADASGKDVPARRHFAEQDERNRRQVARLVAELGQLAGRPVR